MICDIVLGIILLLSMFSGIKKGFTATLLNFFNWFVSIIIAFLFYDKVKEFLIINTSMLKNLTKSTYHMLPTIFDEIILNNKENSAVAIAEFLLAVISFLIIIAIIKLISYLISLLFSKKHHSGIISFTDSLLGLGIGLIRGVVICLLLLILLIPILNFIWPEVSTMVTDNMNESYLASLIYMDNPLLTILQ